jgi:hypothetical protein
VTRRAQLALAGLVLAAAAWWSLRPTSAQRAASSVLVAAAPSASAAPTSSSTRAAPARPLQRTIRDRRTRDDVRERIYAAFGEVPPERHRPRAGTAAPGRTSSGENLRAAAASADAGPLEPEYIKARIREDFVPLAKECYEAALERDPKLAGKMVFWFEIVGDEGVGGVVESADLVEGSTLDEAELTTCMRESLLSISFEAPRGSGRVTVKYPFDLSQ